MRLCCLRNFDMNGVETREINQAVRNNRDKFPTSYMFELSNSELNDLRSKILTTMYPRKVEAQLKSLLSVACICLQPSLDPKEQKMQQ